jgi:ABC-2 type transport system permease protein
MTILQRINPAWWELIRVTARQFYAYRAAVPIICLYSIVQLYVLRVVWEAVYAGQPEVDGISGQVLLVYLSLSTLHRVYFSEVIAWNIQQRVSTGGVAHDLVRPFGFLKQMMALQIGSIISHLAFLVVLVPAAVVVGSLDPPAPANVGLYLASLLLALIVHMLIWMHIGLLSFWVLHVNGIRAMFAVANGFLAGALVPLWLMPDALRIVLQILPFQATVFLPVSIYTEQQTGRDVLLPLLQQAGWIVLLIVTANAMWRRAQHKIVVQGG